MLTEDIKTINRNLIDHFGRTLDNHPKFKVVWTTDENEVRFIESREVVSESGIYLRTEHNITEYAPKYSLFPDNFMLETLLSRDSKGNFLQGIHYEPLWRFIDRNGDNVTPVWPKVQKLVNIYLLGTRVVRSPEDLIREEEAKIAKEKANCKIMLQDNTPAIPFMLKSGAAVTVPSTYGDKK